MSKRKYLFLITGMPMGGAERVMATLANEFVAKGHQVRLVTLKKAISAYELDERIEFIGGNSDITSSNPIFRRIEVVCAAIKSIIFYRRQLKEYKPDMILSFLTNTNLLAIMNNCISIKKYPVIISERCDPRTRSKFLVKLCNKIYPLADTIVCQSKVIENYFLEQNFKAITAVIANPVNEECINKEEITQRQKKIVAVGRLNNQKNYDLLIESFSDIEKDYPEHKLEIYGQGPEENRLQNKIDSLGLKNKILLMGTKQNVMTHVADAEIYVMSSDFEGFPNALVEAMSSGIPVISTNFPTGVAKELIEDGKNGYVVPLRNREALSEAMRKILGDETAQKEMSINNKELRKELNVKNITNKWEELFDDVLEKEKTYVSN